MRIEDYPHDLRTEPDASMSTFEALPNHLRELYAGWLNMISLPYARIENGLLVVYDRAPYGASQRRVVSLAPKGDTNGS